MSVNSACLELSTIKTVVYEIWNVQMKCIKSLTTDSLFWLGASYRKRSNWALFFEKEIVTKETSKRLFRYYAYPELQEHAEHNNLQQDSAPPHLFVLVRQHLNQKYTNHWMGRGDPMLLPHRSPDLKTCDYYYADIWRVFYSVSLLTQFLN